MTLPVVRFPEGLALDMRVIANKRHDAVFPQAPKRRGGRIVAPTGKIDYLRILWDGLAHPHTVHRNFFDVE